ncbi:hypothetical protein HPB50_018689 [Hyalomma asiaticum]|uniref:Uncharacterized protein n=1 Tax=Hyalomma asiaticum TaxID=266040 RepID=A0ACB7SGQ7_HYAAI|nr:hypothetical protein HPB50_018689 [Hyalomma asiaticum]
MSGGLSKDKSSLDGGRASRDCVIRTVDGREFRAHRGFLCAVSPVFQVLFSVDYGGRSDVLLQNVTSPTMDALLSYYYTNKLSINENNATETLAAADMLLMDEVRDECLRYLLRNMDIENCLGMATLAQWYYFPDFNRAVLSFVREHFDQASGSHFFWTVWRTSDEFPSVSETLLVELLKSNELNVRNEADLLHAIVRWSSSRNASPREAGADLSRLLQSVRVGLCGSLALEDFCRLHPTLACSRLYSELVRKAQGQGPCLCSPSPLLLVQYAAHRCPHANVEAPEVDSDGRGPDGDGRNSDVANAATPPRPAAPARPKCERCGVARNPERWLPRMPYEMLFVVGGWSGGHERDTIETAYHGIALLHSRLYVVGGMRGTSYLRTCDCFDIESCTWQTCSTMNIARGYVSAVALGDYVYAVGGRNAGERTASVERYNPRSNLWTLVSAMKRRRSKIYVSGGFNGQKVLTSVEEYTPSNDTWCLVRQLPSPRCSHQMAVLGGRMYVIGGYDGRRRVTTVMSSGDEKEPLLWHYKCPMRIGRSTFSVAQLDGELYVMGGFDGLGTTAEVERYSPSSDSWRPMVPLNEAVSATAACAVKGLNVCRRLSARAER